ncbi:MAG TPA: hypothetical protein VFE62_28265 [Gemmataceae bacterium]|nr:hypothetical protein [Gemmataceae bacterium]
MSAGIIQGPDFVRRWHGRSTFPVSWHYDPVAMARHQSFAHIGADGNNIPNCSAGFAGYAPGKSRALASGRMVNRILQITLLAA